MPEYNDFLKDDHPLLNGRYRWDDPTSCTECDKPVVLDDRVRSGDSGYRHKSCTPPPKCAKCGFYMRVDFFKGVHCSECNDWT